MREEGERTAPEEASPSPLPSNTDPTNRSDNPHHDESSVPSLRDPPIPAASRPKTPAPPVQCDAKTNGFIVLGNTRPKE